MRLMNRTQTALIVSMVAAVAFFGASRISAEPSTPSLVSADYADFGIAYDPAVPVDATGRSVPNTDRDYAIAAAKSALGREDDPFQVLHTRAWRIAAEPMQDAWVVLFAGGVHTAPGAIGAPSRQISDLFEGVVVADSTAEVLRTFGRSK